MDGDSEDASSVRLGLELAWRYTSGMRRGEPFVLVLLLFGCSARFHPPFDAGDPPDVMDAGGDREASAIVGDAAVVSPWRGWHVLTNPANCMVAVPNDPTFMPLWSWMPCETKTANCEQLDLPKYRDVDQASSVFRTWSSYDGRLIDIMRWLDPTYLEHDVFDTKLGVAVASYRIDSLASCWMHPVLGNTLGTFLLQRRNSTTTTGTWLASGGFAQLMTQPNFVQLDPSFLDKQLYALSGQGASDSLIALNANRSSIGRVIPGSAVVDHTAYLQLEEPFVHDQDVLALDDKLVWRREVRVDPKGAVVLLREVANTHALGFHGDGTDLFWTECSGGNSSSFAGHPSVSVWRAPYTVDPGTLDGTAKRVAVLDGTTTSCARPGTTALSAGRYAFADEDAGVFLVSSAGTVRRWNTQSIVDLGAPLSLAGDWITAPARIFPAGKLDWATVLVRVKVP